MYPLFLSGFTESLNFLSRFSKNYQILNSMKTLPVGADFFHESEQTDARTHTHTHKTKLTDAFRNFVNTPNKDK
jgi:hypothetical protein